MYENMNYEAIKNNILSKIQGIDKQEGSFVNDIVSPISMELESNYIELEKILSVMFLEDLTSEYLEKRCSEYGITRKNGTFAIGAVTFTGAENTIIPKNTLLSTTTGINFVTTEEKTILADMVDVPIKATKVGTKYNVEIGTINTVSIGIVGVISVTNKRKLTGGTDIETDEELLNRLLLRLKTPVTSGNKEHYRLWAMEVNGVGDAKIFPIWNGPGTVKVVLVNANKQGANQELIEAVSSCIEDNRPIGANVTVKSAVEKPINVNAKVILANGSNIGDTQQEIIKLIDNYLKEITFKVSYVSIAKIGNLLLNTPGVLDYTNLTVNGVNSNIGLEDEEIPVLGNIELGV